MQLPKFDLGALESICEIFGDTTVGFTGSEIGKLLRESAIDDIMPQITKRTRLFEALKAKQESDKCSSYRLNLSEINNHIKIITQKSLPITLLIINSATQSVN